MPINQDPDANVVALFKMLAIKDEPESIKQGRPIFEDVEACELRYPGSKNVGCFPATSFSHWAKDADGTPYKMTYAERFRRQYQQFKAQAVQTKAGTPLTYAMFLTEARRAELRAQNIYTVEQLADIDGIELKNLGMGGREFKNKAQEYLEEARRGAPNSQMIAELEAMRAKNALLEEDLQSIKSRAANDLQSQAPSSDDKFSGMDMQQLCDFVTTNTGQEPIGAAKMNRKTLERLARNAISTKVA